MIDVCLVLEGTYPYVAGGVSGWIHQLISAMTDIKFAILAIGAYPDPTRTVKYDVPRNVIYLKDVFLHDYALEQQRKRKPKRKDYELVAAFYQDLARERYDRFPEFMRLFQGESSCLDVPTVFSSQEIYQILGDFCWQYAAHISYLDYFWTWRGTHLPVINVLLTETPAAKIYHSISTGYAGLLASVAKLMHGGRFFLTEHGIYNHERMLEISQAHWIYQQEKHRYRAERELSFFKQWWIKLFQHMGHLTYAYADRIFTLYEGNRIREIYEGARPEKISIIPNGIDVEYYRSLGRTKKPQAQIGLIGRVVSIKDIKTFIQAAKRILRRLPTAQFYIVGPTDEEEEYYQECQHLTQALGLRDVVHFTGRVDVEDYYQFLDVVVLTSLSEAQPLSILEAGACGIPVVATDVGACRELLEGRDIMDRSLGHSGLVTEVANPEATGNAVLRLLQEPSLYKSCQQVGPERVQKFYNEEDLLARYLNIYEQNL